MNLSPAAIPSVSDYHFAFEKERANEYAEVEAYEHLCGFSVDKDRLDRAAGVLACPVKTNPPNWQHGRVLYAAMRKYLAAHDGSPVLCFDCGTAKGFSALVAQWALDDSDTPGEVHSVDVIDPFAEVFRNSVLDCTRKNRLADYLTPWPEAQLIRFYKLTGMQWLASDTERVNVAFIDGKHATDVVATEGRMLSARQNRGDLAIFDDVQIPAVAEGLKALTKLYTFQRIALSQANREYAVGVRT